MVKLGLRDEGRFGSVLLLYKAVGVSQVETSHIDMSVGGGTKAPHSWILYATGQITGVNTLSVQYWGGNPKPLAFPLAEVITLE